MDHLHEHQPDITSTAHVLEELQLFGYRPFSDEPDPRPLPEGYRVAAIVLDDITRLALSLGGTISGEHGIGAVKRHELPWQLDAGTLAAQRAIKLALDPRGILTPGRAI